MPQRKDLPGQPEEENTASSSTQSATGLGGGTPEGGPIRPHDRARRNDDEPRIDDESGQDDADPPSR